jgi:hypothetical protein
MVLGGDIVTPVTSAAISSSRFIFCRKVRARSCSKSFEQLAQESLVDELQAGLSSRSQFFDYRRFFSSQAKLHSNPPALGYYLEGVQFAAFGYLYRDVLAQDFAHTLRERLSHIVAVGRQAMRSLATAQRLQIIFAIRNLCRGHRYRVWQALCVHCDITLDA